MIITQERIFSDSESSVSTVFVDSQFECFFIEDEYREHKVPKETRIPAGEYRILLKTYGGFHSRYSRKFPDFHKGMLWLQNVEGFKDILIHVGNYEHNTAGCLLTNSGVYCEADNISGQASVTAYKKLYKKVVQAAIDHDLWIEIFDKDFGDVEGTRVYS